MRHKRIAGIIACLAAVAAVIVALPSHHAAPAKPVAARYAVGHADWVRPGSFGKMKAAADAVVEGHVARIDDGDPLAAKGHAGTFMPTLRVRVSVDRVLHGRAPDVVTLFQVGGKGPDGRPVYLEGDPPYRVGEHVALFLIPGTPGVYHTGPDGRFAVGTDGKLSNPSGSHGGYGAGGLTVDGLKAKVDR